MISEVSILCFLLVLNNTNHVNFCFFPQKMRWRSCSASNGRLAALQLVVAWTDKIQTAVNITITAPHWWTWIERKHEKRHNKVESFFKNIFIILPLWSILLLSLECFHYRLVKKRKLLQVCMCVMADGTIFTLRHHVTVSSPATIQPCGSLTCESLDCF